MSRRLRLAAAIAVGALAAMPVGVSAQTADNYVGSVDQPRSFTAERPTPTGQLGRSVSRRNPDAALATLSDDRLAVTGGDLAGLTVIGLAALGSGGMLVRRSRRLRPHT